MYQLPVHKIWCWLIVCEVPHPPILFSNENCYFFKAKNLSLEGEVPAKNIWILHIIDFRLRFFYLYVLA